MFLMQFVVFSTIPKYHIQHSMYEAYHDMDCVSLSQLTAESDACI